MINKFIGTKRTTLLQYLIIIHSKRINVQKKSIKYKTDNVERDYRAHLTLTVDDRILNVPKINIM